MKAYEATAMIDADPETIWEVLADGAGYTSWDAGVERVEGTIAPGETIKVYSSVAPGRTFPVKVVEFEPGRSMTWSSGMPLGLFKGRRRYTLSPQPDGTVRFHMREEFSGPLLGLIGRTIPDLQPSFDQFASGLKSRAESGR